MFEIQKEQRENEPREYSLIANGELEFHQHVVLSLFPLIAPYMEIAKLEVLKTILTLTSTSSLGASQNHPLVP